MGEDQGGAQRSLLPQRAELADFGTRAAEGADLDGLLQDAAQQAAQALEVHYVKVLEYLPAEKRLLVRAGVGWGEGEKVPRISPDTFSLLMTPSLLTPFPWHFPLARARRQLGRGARP
jgi:hypothetical protein